MGHGRRQLNPHQTPLSGLWSCCQRPHARILGEETMRRWQHLWTTKMTTHCDDLASALWHLSAGRTAKDIDLALDAIRPASGWREQTNFNPRLSMVRTRPYGCHYMEKTFTDYD